jgi:hypothetical protein
MHFGQQAEGVTPRRPRPIHRNVDIADPSGLAIHETLHIVNPERRNIVAQVRREAVESSVLSSNPCCGRAVTQRKMCGAMRQFIDDCR